MQLDYNKMESKPRRNVAQKKEKLGRWSRAESQLFQVLVERYGKNWLKIQSLIKGRTPEQVRSHGQKYFKKIGEQRAQEYTRRAKVIQAIEVLKMENMWVDEAKGNEALIVKKQEEQRDQGWKDESIKNQAVERVVQEQISREQYNQGSGSEIPQEFSQNIQQVSTISKLKARQIAPIICYPTSRSYSSTNLQDFEGLNH